MENASIYQRYSIVCQLYKHLSPFYSRLFNGYPANDGTYSQKFPLFMEFNLLRLLSIFKKDICDSTWPVLMKFNPDKQIVIESDASD